MLYTMVHINEFLPSFRDEAGNVESGPTKNVILHAKLLLPFAKVSS